MKTKQHTQMMIEGGIMIALATVLSYFKFSGAWAFGGSVTLGSMIPLIIYALRRGVGPGILVGMIYGSLQYLIEPYFVHYAQVAIDYFVAFGALGLAGLFSGKSEIKVPQIVAAVTTALVSRFVFHVISGAIFFGQYAAEGQSALAYSLVYNATYMGAELVITLVIAVGLASALKKQLVSQR